MAAQEPVELIPGSQSSTLKSTEDRSPELIAQDIERTRESLAHKLNRLEEEVEDKVRNTVDQVSGRIVGTVDDITGRVRNSIAAVQNRLDLNARLQNAPVQTLGGFLVAGMAVGMWLGFRARRVQTSAYATSQASGILSQIVRTVAVTAAQHFIQGKVSQMLQAPKTETAGERAPR